MSEMSYDASYKFENNLFKFKTEEKGKRPAHVATEVPSPPQNYLFLLRIKNWEKLEKINIDESTLSLIPPWICSQLIIFFSFEGRECLPFMPEDKFLKPKQGSTFFIDLPMTKPYNKLWIGVGEDVGNSEPYDITFYAPNYRQ